MCPSAAAGTVYSHALLSVVLPHLSSPLSPPVVSQRRFHRPLAVVGDSYTYPK